jgi:hypothetical protein
MMNDETKKESTWDKIVFANKVVLSYVTGISMLVCSVVVATWVGMLVSMTTNQAYGIMATIWILVLGIMTKGFVSTWVAIWLFSDSKEESK